MTWRKVPGTPERISVGSAGNIWGVTSSGQIYRHRQGDLTNPWIHVPSSPMDVPAAADGSVWGVSASGSIFRYIWARNSWHRVPGTLRKVSVGHKGDVWGVTAAGSIFRYTGNDSRPWRRVSGNLVDISVGADGVVWGVSAAGSIFRSVGQGNAQLVGEADNEGDEHDATEEGEIGDTAELHWVRVAGKLAIISGGNRANVWGVSKVGDVYHATRGDPLAWVKVVGKLMWIVQALTGRSGESPQMVEFIAGFDTF